MDYYYDKLEFGKYMEAFKELKDDIILSKIDAMNLYEEIKNGKWTGKSKDAMVAFMDLMVQYHNEIAKGDGVVYEGYDAMKKMRDSGDSICVDYKEYKDIEGIE